jgi:hypothetical protein
VEKNKMYGKLRKVVICAAYLLTAAQVLRAQTNFTKLSDTEYIDLSRISFVRFSRTIDLSNQGGDAEFRTANLLIADGVSAMSPDAENKLKELLPTRLTKLSDFEYIDMRLLTFARFQVNWFIVGGSSVGLSPQAQEKLLQLLQSNGDSTR